MPTDADVIVVGAGLAGLVATAELADAGKKVLLLDQEPEQSLGGQAFWSLGGLFLVDTPEQRRMGIKDSRELALQDWMGSAQFDRESDHWPRKWAEAYVDFAAGEKRQWLHDQGLRIFPVVGWAERGGGLAGGHGNSVPRFHLTWGTGPGVVAPFERRVKEAVGKGLVEIRYRHQVDDLVKTDGVVTGVVGTLLAPDAMDRGRPSNREAVGDFSYSSQAVIVTSGGIGGNHDQVRKQWPVDRLGQPPKTMVAGVPAHVDGRMQFITEAAGAEIINPDRMWHYTEGLRNWDPIWENHGIRILPGPSSLWLSATGERFGAPYLPGFDTLGTLGAIMRTGYDYSWFVLTQKVIEKEFALSGSEQNPDLTGKDLKLLLKRIGSGAPGPVEAFKQHGEDFVVADNLEDLVAGMHRVSGDSLITVESLRRTITERDRELDNDFTKDIQITYLRGHRSYRGDKLIRVASPHKFLDPKNGPLIAVRLNILTRKTLGGLHTDLDARVLQPDGTPLPGVYAAGEVAGFGGGGVHGYNALEGTFLGGCIFSGRIAGRAAAKALG
ncbi:FAD-binding dehydrogenase [Nocardioides marmoriginsengisoli]|uniref:FAD-binding dehydrogenase n=1 Tax=Nocardioides marmoriginsengisoli TaxID=661483 RepID=A0A3N0CAW3_9ACTN|nr:FAD-binding dehydrogenase [Nocardioides marmoriginsengisoli]RNL60614.1 FAD-binding dehydrogenase [Nocardioides marmoriginsengisoli]